MNEIFQLVNFNMIILVNIVAALKTVKVRKAAILETFAFKLLKCKSIHFNLIFAYSVK